MDTLAARPLAAHLHAARAGGALSADAATQLEAFLARPDLAAWERDAVAELAEAGAWTELDDRFYRRLRFGTGGLRGRTIGRVVAPSERGAASEGARPARAAVGVNCLNDRAVADATRGLVRWLRAQAGGAAPSLAVAYDTRHFSPEFARVTAETARDEGATVHLYASAASTPQLAFTVRETGAMAGVVLTASHNPPHDNGYKIYLGDGSQIVEPAASEIAAAIEAARGSAPAVDTVPGTIHVIGAELDEPFLDAIRAGSATPRREGSGAPVRIVYTPLHGTGIRIIPRALAAAGVAVHVVESQATPDGAFPTVPSPNPEDPRVFAEAIAVARVIGADAVLATDPDADRLGIGARTPDGDYALLTGNQIGALLADFRLTRLRETGVITPENAGRAAIVKTFVTTDLIAAIAEHHGVHWVETLTGFKYIGAKQRAYAALAHPESGGRLPLSRADGLARGRHLVLGTEESYGYLAGDYIRDKDANGAALMLAELLLDVAARGTTVLAQLDALYLRHGYHADRLQTLPFEGASGGRDMARLLESYRLAPPARVAGSAVVEAQDFSRDTVVDADGERVPSELMLRWTLADGGRITVRGSGTEPKLKYYVALRAPAGDAAELSASKQRLDARLDAVWAELRADVAARLAAAPIGA